MKGHPPAGVQAQPTQQQIMQRMAELERAVQLRGRMLFGEMMDALVYTTMAAQAGDPVARAELQQFLKSLENARLALSVLVPPGNGTPG